MQNNIRQRVAAHCTFISTVYSSVWFPIVSFWWETLNFELWDITIMFWTKISSINKTKRAGYTVHPIWVHFQRDLDVGYTGKILAIIMRRRNQKLSFPICVTRSVFPPSISRSCSVLSPASLIQLFLLPSCRRVNSIAHRLFSKLHNFSARWRRLGPWYRGVGDDHTDPVVGPVISRRNSQKVQYLVILRGARVEAALVRSDGRYSCFVF